MKVVEVGGKLLLSGPVECERVGERFHVDGDAQTRVGLFSLALAGSEGVAEYEQTHHQSCFNFR